ncbi:hypothetical protein [Halochromatium salexigens]|uniref:Uncharacterized protein n=1 Tax=Halochromatium salexigens TaxID=49447 RepID=A0AAJ0XFD9_HALSE|nr:hypothetical protein [Halochromatium salexigens]MBK5930268.1 hypothetical protein [Halochromatium salexigens]
MVSTAKKAASRIGAALLLPVLLMLLLTPVAGVHGDETQASVPAALLPWVDWVLADEDQRACALGAAGAGERVCAWPGRLRLDLDEAGGRFEQAWSLAANAWIALPGGPGQWPQQVSANGAPVSVVERDGRPMVRLASGEHEISGRFTWPRRPDVLQVPAEVGLLSLSLNGTEVAQPRLEAQGGLWLGAKRRPRPPKQAQEPDALSLEVTRRIEDSVPLRVQTRLLLEVSGQPRELLLGPVLLPGGIPLRLESPLPARLIAAKEPSETRPAGSTPDAASAQPSGPRSAQRAGQGDPLLQLQLRPGRWELILESHHPGPVSALSLPQQPSTSVSAPAPVSPSHWPAQEVWVFAARPDLRQVELSGAEPIDPRQIRLPAQWQQRPAYLMQAGETLRLEQLSRGASGSDQIRLARVMRLDFDATGLSLRDRLSGELRERRRIEATAPLVLGQVSVDGEPRLITRLNTDRDDDEERAGVEVRGARLALSADARIDTGPIRWWLELPGSGWDLPLSGVSTQLFLPPGWDLLAAASVDNLPESWLARWSLLDIFLVLIAALAVTRLWGWPWGLLALLTLVLTWQEPGAPRWVWLHLIAAAALVRLLPASARQTPADVQQRDEPSGDASPAQGPPWLATGVRLYARLALLSLVLIAVPFLVTEMRDGLFPQLEQQGLGLIDSPSGWLASRSAVDQVASQLSHQLESSRLKSAPAEVSAERVSPPRSLPTLDPDARLQTGAGVPDWRWRRFELSWNGPMPPDHRLRLWLRPASASLPLALITLVLVPLLGLRLADPRPSGLPLPARSPGARPSGTSSKQALVGLLGVTLIGSLWLLPSSPGLAATDSQIAAAPPMMNPAANRTGFPPTSLLNELRARLLAPPDCVPRCAEIARLVLDASPGALRLLLAVDAAEAVALPIPGARSGWSPTRIELDGQPLDRLLGLTNGELAVPIPSGRHLLLLSGSLVGVDQVAIPLPLRPRLVETRLDPIWQLEGVGADGVPGDQLRLLRQQEAKGLAAGDEPDSTSLDDRNPGGGVPLGSVSDSLSGSGSGSDSTSAPASGAASGDRQAPWPPLLKITRTLRFGLDWELITEVERRSPLGQSVSLRVALIDGESVTTSGVQVRDAEVLVSLPPGRARMRWRSALRPVDRLALRASSDPRLTEEWRLQVSPIWHLRAQGVPAVQPRDGDARALPTYRPWPGEVLALSLSRPVGVAGPTLTLDRSRYQLQPGRRSSEALLELNLRSSQGGRHRLLLPADAEPTRLRVDGQSRPLLMQDNAVELALVPGSQRIELGWLQPDGLSFVYQPAAVTLGVAGVNAETQVRLGTDRWLLWASGPGLGPAVQFWGLLLVMAVLALILARARLTPLGVGDWLLLGIGLSQVSIWVGALVVLWLFALGLRRRLGEGALAPWRFNLMQIGLVLLSIAALSALLLAVQQGLLGSPAMQVAGNGSSATELNWYLDRSGEQTAPVTVISAPIWIYRLLMLAWALWLAWRLLDWLRWGWQGLVSPTPWLRSRRQTLKRKVDEQQLSVDL